MVHQKGCIFCQIVAGEIPAPKLFEDEWFICIRDIRPQAKTHLLIVPKSHIPDLTQVFPDQSGLAGRMLEVAARIAKEQGLASGGYRVVINTGLHGGQTVFHLHLHLLGGEPLRGDFG